MYLERCDEVEGEIEGLRSSVSSDNGRNGSSNSSCEEDNVDEGGADSSDKASSENEEASDNDYDEGNLSSEN